MACFRCNTTENFIFLLKYRQRKVDLNTSKKSLVFVTIRHLYVQLSYTKISYLRKNTHLRKDAAFLHFRLKESSANMIFPLNGNIQKQMKIWSFLHFSQIFVRRKFFFSWSESNNLNYSIVPKFNKVNRSFVLPFENQDDRASFSKFNTPNVEIEDYNVAIDGNFWNIWQNYWNE